MAHQGVSYKAEQVPKIVAAEFRRAAREASLNLKVGFARLIGPPIEPADDPAAHAAWVDSLVAKIMEGQARAREFAGAEVEMVSTHLPQPYRAALVEAARTLGIQVGGAGRLILIAVAGKMLGALSRGPAAVPVTATTQSPATQASA